MPRLLREMVVHNRPILYRVIICLQTYIRRYINNQQSTTMQLITMAMGDYDEDEHERRERKTSTIDTDFTDDRTVYEGKIHFDSGETAEELLDQFNKIKSK